MGFGSPASADASECVVLRVGMSTTTLVLAATLVGVVRALLASTRAGASGVGVVLFAGVGMPTRTVVLVATLVGVALGTLVGVVRAFLASTIAGAGVSAILGALLGWVSC